MAFYTVLLQHKSPIDRTCLTNIFSENMGKMPTTDRAGKTNKIFYMTTKYVIGIDYGTDSVRSVVVNTANGDIAGTSVFEYPRWKKGLYCDPSVNRFRQHPLDYIEGLEQSVKGALKGLGAEVISNIAGITVDTTGSTPVAVDKEGVPLSLKPGFEDNPDAMFVLWKDHTAVKEAAEINELARTGAGQTLQSMKEVSIHPNGSGQRSFMFSGAMKKSGMPPGHGWSIATGFPPC